MTTIRKHFWVLAAGVLLLLVAINFVPRSAIAQTVRTALVQDVDSPGRRPVQLQAFTASGGFFFYTVPANTRLVIQHIAASCSSPTPVSAFRLTTNGSSHEFLMNLKPWYDSVHFATSEPLTAYSEPGTQVGASFPGSTGNCGVTMVGYLVGL